MKLRVSALLLVAGALVAGCGSAHTKGTSSPSPLSGSAPAGSAWATYGGNLYNQRYSRLDQISGSEASLSGQWVFHTGLANADTSFEASPLVVGRRMFVTDPHSDVFALDATNGHKLWSYAPTYTDLAKLPLCCGQSNRGVAAGAGMVFVGQLDGKLTALDASSGDVRWSVQVGSPKLGYSETAAPLYHDGIVYIGVSGGEYEIGGYVTAYDARTGKRLWRWHTLRSGHGSFPNGWPAQHGGGGVWATAALDPRLGLLYFVVGNPSPDLDGHIRPGKNLYTDSIVALDAKSGKLKWYFQEVHHDIWDADPAGPPLLFDAKSKHGIVHGLAQASKTGWVYLFDRSTGKPLVPIRERAVPQDAWQKTWPTQPVVDERPFVPQRCPPGNGNYPQAGVFTPIDPRRPALRCPGGNGGSEWSPLSFDPHTNDVYVCGIHEPQVYATHSDKKAPGTLRLGSIWERVKTGHYWGTLTAVDVLTGKHDWQVRLPTMCIGGTLATAGGLVYVGEGDGKLEAYDAGDGTRAWSFQTGAGVNAPPVTYEIDGVQYVAVASGGSWQLDYPRGDSVWAFTQGGALPEAPAPQLPPLVLATTKVKILASGYLPARLLVKPGTRIEWTNDTSTSQTVSSQTGLFDSGTLAPGGSWSHTFGKPGAYDFGSKTTPALRGTVVVSAG